MVKGWCKPYVIIFCISLVVWLGLVVLRSQGILQAMELLTKDYLMTLRPDSEYKSPIVLISETEADIKRYGYPLSDDIFANSLEKLLAAGARVIGVDKYRDIPVPSGTEHLNKVLSSHDNIIWIFFVGDSKQGRIAPPAVLKNSDKIGFNDMVNDPDGVSRRGLLFLDDKGVTYYAFPLLLALHYLAAENIQPKNDSQGYLQLGKQVFVPLQTNTGSYAGIDASGYQFLFTYPHLHHDFPTFTIGELLDGKIPESVLCNKTVLIGAMAPSLSDYKLFPDGSRHYGVELHAHITDQLIQTSLHDYPLIRAWSDNTEYAWLLLWCILGSIASFYRGGMVRLLLLSSSGLIILSSSAFIAFQAGWWLPLLSSVFVWLLALTTGIFWFSNQDRNERKQLLRLFEQHVSPQVATALWEKREEFFGHNGVKPDQLTATVLFTDLVNFTTLAEGMNPLNLMNWLNEYMDEMSHIIIEEGGMINKYIGDAIMAVFGAPVKKDDAVGITADALNAVESAVRMGEKLLTLNVRWQQQGLPFIGMRVGIYTGTLVAGTLGGQQRMEYTVIGDTVNTASRLESFDKTVAPPNAQQPCRILIGESTWQLIRNHYQTEQIGECQLKGKHNILNIYRVLERITPPLP
jgi:adenylate cyclase